MKSISVIITGYNVEAYIATAMQSVIDTRREGLELIVVDDGSNDATRQIADLVGQAAPGIAYRPIHFSRNTPGGVASAANAGLDRARGDIVIFVDGDDWVLPDNLNAAIDRHLETMPDMTVCGCKEYWNNNGAYSHYPEAQVWAQIGERTTLTARREAVLMMAPFPWRKIYSRAFLERHRIRFPVGDFFYEDNPFHWNTTLRAERIGFFRADTHVHRMARAGQSVTEMGLKPLKIFDHAETIRACLVELEQGEALRERYFQWLIDHILWCGRHVPPWGQNRVFEKARSLLEDFDEAQFWTFLERHPREIGEIRKAVAIHLDDRMGYLREC